MARDDSLPATLAKAPGFVRKQVRRVLATRYLAYYFRRRPAHPALSERRALAAVRDADRILFLCWGNVCRSPMAARYLEAALEGTPGADVTVRSAGLGEREGRPSPPTAVEVAARFGVDLSGHRSVRAEEALVAESDAVFVMDRHNYHLLRSDVGAPEGEVFFLSTLAPEGDEPVDIPDPHGGDAAEFERVYARIAAAVDRIAAAVARTERTPRATESAGDG